MKEQILAIYEKARHTKIGSDAFTLIELLVVIAIIAILVVIVIVAINPVQRLNDASNRRAASNVRATGTLIDTCITLSLAQPGGSVSDCDTPANISTAGEGNVPPNVGILLDAASPNTAVVCAWELGSTGHHWFFESHLGTTVDFGATAPTAADCG